MTWYLYNNGQNNYWSMQPPCYVKDILMATIFSNTMPTITYLAQQS